MDRRINPASSVRHVLRFDAASPELAGPSVRPFVRLECSLCGQEFQVPAEGDQILVTCPSCGLSFSERVSPPCQDMPDNSASEVLDVDPGGDLDRWLSGAPVSARERSDWEEAREVCRRRPVITTFAVAAALVVATTAILGMWGYSHTAEELADVDRARETLEEQWARTKTEAADQADRAESHLKTAHQAVAEREVARQRLQQAEALREKAENERLVAIRTESHIRTQAASVLAAEMAKRSQELLASDPDRSLFLAGEAARSVLVKAEPLTSGMQQTLRDALAKVGGRGLVGHEKAVESITVSQDGRWLLTGGSDNTARLWDFASDHPVASSIALNGHSDRVTSVAFTPNGHWAITAGQDATAMLWNLRQPNPAQSPILLTGHRSQIHTIAVSPDSRWLATAAGGLTKEDYAARLWDLSQENPAESATLLRGHEGPIRTIAMSPNSRWVVTGSDDCTVRIYDLAVKYPAAAQTVLKGHAGPVVDVAISSNSLWMVTGSWDKTARIWALTSDTPGKKRELRVLHGHKHWVGSVDISPDRNWVATGGFDSETLLWSSSDPTQEPITLTGHDGRIHKLRFTPDGHWLVTCSHDRTARLWDMASTTPGESSMVLRGHEGPVTTLAIDPSSRWMATGSSGRIDGDLDPIVRLWNLGVDGLLDSARVASAGRLSEEDRRRTILEAAKNGQLQR